jgi:hypothetical protein
MIIHEQMPSNDSHVVFQAMSTLWQSFLTPDLSCNPSLFAFQCGAHRAIIKAMKLHSYSLRVKTNGNVLLTNLATANGGGDAILGFAGVKWCLEEALDRTPASGCMLISVLCGCSEFDHEKGLQAVLKIIKPLSREMVWAQGFHALNMLLRSHPILIKKTADEGGIPVVVGAMLKFPHISRVQKDGCNILCAIAKGGNHGHIKSIIDASGHEAVLAARRGYKGKKDVVEPATTCVNIIFEFWKNL